MKTVKTISLKASKRDVEVLTALQQHWGLSASDTVRFCLIDGWERAQARAREKASWPASPAETTAPSEGTGPRPFGGDT